MTTQKIRTRYAPSPTGFLHLGGLRTALYNWLFARANGGEFLVRVEDTDRAREVENSVDQILESMALVGMDWDEDPVFQSQRGDIYKEYFQKLMDADLIYPAFETKEELDEMRALAMQEKRPAVYNRAAREMSKEERDAKIAEGIPHVWRFKTPLDGDTIVNDLLMGGDETRFANTQIGDFAITRPSADPYDFQPLYNFVVTVDDALMQITHVIRGVEHLGNAAKQTLLYKAWGFDVPQFLHLPLILKGGKKMSKRDSDTNPMTPVSVTARRDLGFLPEGIANYIALLGWTAPDENELLSLDDLKSQFTLERLSKSNANFDEDKFLHINSWHLRHLSDDDLVARLAPFLDSYDLNHPNLKPAVLAVKDRCHLLQDFSDAIVYFFEGPKGIYDEKGTRKFFDTDISATILNHTIEGLEALSGFSAEAIQNVLHDIMADMDLKFGKFGPVIRLALTGRMQSPSVAEVMAILGQDESVSRLKSALDFVSHRKVA